MDPLPGGVAVKLVILTGPHAVGKMTVGQALERRTGLRLFHNHESLEPLLHLFPDRPDIWGPLSNQFRWQVFDAFSQTDAAGLIFTYMWAFDAPEDRVYIERLRALFEGRGAPVYLVELAADRAVRLVRNRSENRLLHKPSKRDLRQSEALFCQLEGAHRLNSLPGEIDWPHYLQLDNTDLSPEEAAARICETFAL